MTVRMKKYFIDNTHVSTDAAGSRQNQWPEIGWYDSNSGKYYNPDEVKEIFDAGEAENVGKRDDGSLYMKTEWLDARTAFNTVCGIPFGVREGQENLVEYAKKIGLVTDEPVPVKMFSGIKTMNINEDGTYDIQYTVDKIIGEIYYSSYIMKICLGSINKLRNSTIRYYDGKHPGGELRWPFKCKDASFDEDTLVLEIKGIDEQYMMKTDLTHTLRLLDLELYVANSRLFDRHDIFHAATQFARDYGQSHWLHENRHKDETKLNTYWWDKPPVSK